MSTMKTDEPKIFSIVKEAWDPVGRLCRKSESCILCYLGRLALLLLLLFWFWASLSCAQCLLLALCLVITASKAGQIIGLRGSSAAPEWNLGWHFKGKCFYGCIIFLPSIPPPTLVILFCSIYAIKWLYKVNQHDEKNIFI